MSLNFHVSPAVLIPRPETEFIAEYVIDNYKNKQITGLDLATGSGCLAISILHNLPDSKFIASDISHDALIITKKNALTHNVYNRLLLVNGDMLSPFTTATFDIIVSNPPYISLNDYKNTLAPELQHEPSIALTDGKDGYHFYKIITTQTALHLKSEGELLLELGFGQLSQVIKFIPDTLFVQKIIKDYSGIDRVLVLRKK